MTIDHVPMPDPQEQPLVTEEVVKPKRTRRPKVSEDAAAAVVEPVAAVVVAPEPAEAAPVEAKRAPRRRKVAEAVDVVEAAPVAAEPVVAEPVAEAVVAEAPVEAKPRRAPRKKVQETQAVLDLVEPASEAPSALPKESAPHGVLELAPEAADAVPAPTAEAGEGEAAAPQEGRGRRDRNRDRGERSDRGERPGRGDRAPRAEADRAPRAEGAPMLVDGALPEGEGDGGEQRPSRRAAMAAEQTEEVFAELLSGDFDEVREEEEAAEATGEEAAAYKRVLRPEPDAPKLQKVLAQAGVGSRRDIEQMIEDGRIEVNDQVAHIGQRISFGDRIKVAGRPIKIRIQPPAARILAYHKPTGEVVTHDDPQGRPTVFRRLPRLQNGKWMSVGRLDLNTEGLLLFTNSGELANQLMHPRFGVEREYAVRTLGTLDEGARNRLLAGVEIEGQSASFVSISKGEGEGVNQWYRVVITEGRNREVRKLFDAVGLTVNRLIRVRYGAIVLPRGLKRGVWVELGESDVRAVKSLAGMDRQDFAQGQGQQGQGQPRQNKGQGQQPANRGQQGGGQQGQQRADGGFKSKNGRNGGSQQGGQGGQGGRQGGQGPQGGNGYGPQGNRPPRPNQDRPQQERQASPRHDGDDDGDHIGPIPNPLEQTFDKRFAKGSKRITAGFGRPDQNHGRDVAPQPKGSPKQPDPLQTSVGYIGADAYFGKVGGGGRRGGSGGGGGGGGGGRGRR
jgi:23S rRNA pseudouridine2605 synthase